MVSGFLYSLTYQHVTIILFEQTLIPLGQRERASRDEGYSTQDGLVVTCHERSLYQLAKQKTPISRARSHSLEGKTGSLDLDFSPLTGYQARNLYHFLELHVCLALRH